MFKYKIGICGNFDTTCGVNGQTQKTLNVRGRLIEKYGEANVSCFDTGYFRKNPVNALVKYLKFLKSCENVIILPAQGALRLTVTLAVKFKRKYGYKIYYLVIGAWLAEFIKNKPKLKRKLKSIDCIFPETESLMADLEKEGLRKLDVLVNFKNIEPIELNEIKTDFKLPYRICFFSRITYKKGVTDLINAIKELNFDEVKFILDIYGVIDENYREEFFRNIEPPYINYKGVVEYDKGTDVLKEYYMHIFPTKFATEGIPGSIVDSYIAGLPLIASKWNSCLDIIDENKTGLVYEFDEFEGLKEKLMEAYNNPDKIIAMRKNCIEKAKMYTGPNVMDSLVERIEGRI